MITQVRVNTEWFLVHNIKMTLQESIILRMNQMKKISIKMNASLFKNKNSKNLTN